MSCESNSSSSLCVVSNLSGSNSSFTAELLPKSSNKEDAATSTVIISSLALIFLVLSVCASAWQVFNSKTTLKRDLIRSQNESLAFLQLQPQQRAAIIHDGTVNHVKVLHKHQDWKNTEPVIRVPDFTTIDLKRYPRCRPSNGTCADDVFTPYGIIGVDETKICSRVEDRVNLFRFHHEEGPAIISTMYHLAAALSAVFSSSSIWNFGIPPPVGEEQQITRTSLSADLNAPNLVQVVRASATLSTNTSYYTSLDFEPYWNLLLSVGTEWDETEDHKCLFATTFWGRTTIYAIEGRIFMHYQHNNLLLGREEAVSRWSMEAPLLMERLSEGEVSPRVLVAIASGEGIDQIREIRGIHMEYMSNRRICDNLEHWIYDLVSKELISHTERLNHLSKERESEQARFGLHFRQWLLALWLSREKSVFMKELAEIACDEKEDIEIILSALSQEPIAQEILSTVKVDVLRVFCNRVELKTSSNPEEAKRFLCMKRIMRATSIAHRVRVIPFAAHSMNLRGATVAYMG